jgi:hypothetical protein
MHMVQHCATRCSCIAILWVSLVSFAAITLCIGSRRVFIVVFYFVMTQSGNFWIHPLIPNSWHYPEFVWCSIEVGIPERTHLLTLSLHEFHYPTFRGVPHFTVKCMYVTTKISVFRVVTPCLHCRAKWFHPENGGSMVLRNGGVLPSHYMVSQFRRPRLESSAAWKPQNSLVTMTFVSQHPSVIETEHSGACFVYLPGLHCSSERLPWLRLFEPFFCPFKPVYLTSWLHDFLRSPLLKPTLSQISPIHIRETHSLMISFNIILWTWIGVP